ncbi:extracellular solute-binding protein [Celerinatantimonas sp. YJH-8]|uniref:extracellular solute-binding protein n=1 Tax=Celerinatantimonas sp. YJH-8 TaxID=3228714 RepID=UPI0038CBD697
MNQTKSQFIRPKYLALAVAALLWQSGAQAAENIHVTYAGSMGVVMDKVLGPAFAQQNNVHFQGQGQGAYGMAHLLASKKIVADVFVSITPGPIQILEKAGLVDHAVPVASTSMVIAYNPKGKYAAQFANAAQHPDQQAWWSVLEQPGVHFGRTDPKTDPQGRNIIFTMQLAGLYYHQPDLMQKVLGSYQNPKQVFTEGGLLTRLEAGQIDASSGYEAAVRSAGLPFISLPDQMNLSNPDMSVQWYDKAGFSIKNAQGKTMAMHTQPLVYYAAILKNAPEPKEGAAFIKFMQSAKGQALMQKSGYSAPKGGDI